MADQAQFTVDPAPVVSFSGEWRYLSNFYVLDAPLLLGAPWWTPEVAGGFATTEHAYQAAKVEPATERFAEHYRRIAEAPSAGEAKRLGQRRVFEEHGITLRAGWDQIQVPVMLACLRAKFADEQLARRLVWTSPRQLIEGNTWGDTFWGVCNGAGKNMLGRCLMLVRQELNVAMAAQLDVREVRGG